MNLLLYFCVPLVVTGQVVFEKRQRQKDVDNQEASETELYSKHEYGSHVGYKISPINEFAIGNQGEYYRKPGIEDDGAVGVPNIYNSDGGGGGNNDHPSFITSDIYNSIKGKKNNDGKSGNGGNANNNHQKPSSPLAYGAPSSSHHHQNEITESHQQNLSPVVQQSPLIAGQSVLYQDPHTGQLVQGSLLKNGEVPSYQSQGAPRVEYGVPQQVAPIPTLKAISSPVYQEQTPAISIYEAHSNHKSVEEHNHQNSLLKTPVAPAYQHQILKASDETVYQGPDGQLYQNQLLKTHEGTVIEAPVYQPQLFKGTDGVLYQKQVSLAHQPQIFKGTDGILYQKQVSPAHQPQLFKGTDGILYQKQISPAHEPQLFKGTDGILYQKQVSPAQEPQLFKGTDGVLYQKQVSPAYQLVKSPEGVVYQAPVDPAYQQQILHAPEKVAYKAPAPQIYEHQLLKTSDEVVHKSPVAPVYENQLLKLSDGVVYKTPVSPAYQLVKSPEGVVYQVPIVPTHEHQLLKTPEGVVYKQPVHQPEVAPIYSAPIATHENVLLKTDPIHSHHHHHPSVLKTALYHQALHHQPHGNPIFLKSADGTIYQAQNQYLKPAANPELITSPIYQTKEPVPERFLLKDATVPLYKQPALNDVTAHKLLKTSSIIQDTPGVIHQHVLKTAVRPLLYKTPLLKTSEVEASIVPAIEEHYPQFQNVHTNQLLVKAPLQQLTQYLAPAAPNVSPVYQQVLVQKAILHKQPALIEKAVIKEALSPVYTQAVHDHHHHSHDPIVKAPILPSHYVRARLPPDHPDLPARIVTSHKPLVNSLISSGRFRGGRDTNVELVPSKSYGYSYSLYPNARGLYNRPTKPRKHK